MASGLRNIIRGWRGYALAILLVAAATAVFVPGRHHFAKGQWGLLYLLVIVFVASFGGIRPAILASIMSFLALNYFFLPPHQTFHVEDLKDWLSLFVFLVVAVATGMQTGKLREREAQARTRERETALLNRFSAHLVSELSIEEMAGILSDEVALNVKASSAALFVPDGSGRLSMVGSSSSISADVIALVEAAAECSTAIGLPEIDRRRESEPEGWPASITHEKAGFEGPRTDMVVPLRTSTNLLGFLYVGTRRDGRGYSVSEARLLAAIANQAAAFLERIHLHALAVQADALREADRLKSTFVSSVSHELKTPLASITATVTNMLESDLSWDEEGVRGELEAVRDDLDRLNESINSLVDLSRLESAAWEAKKDRYELGEIFGTTLDRMTEKQKARISFSLPDDIPALYVDFAQISRVFRNILENALAYSGSEAPARVGARVVNKEVHIWIEDEGPGIPPEERGRVFEKFYRGKQAAKAPSGTGLGLAIAQEIVKSHGGRIWVEGVEPHGTRVVVSLPGEVE